MEKEIYIQNPLIKKIRIKYENKMINDKPIISIKKFNSIDKNCDGELIRLKINTDIEELKDIIGIIKPKRFEYDYNEEKLIFNIYLDNLNDDVYALKILFNIEVFLIIDIYHSNYKKIPLSIEEEIFDVIMFDLSGYELF